MGFIGCIFSEFCGRYSPGCCCCSSSYDLMCLLSPHILLVFRCFFEVKRLTDWIVGV